MSLKTLDIKIFSEILYSSKDNISNAVYDKF